MINSRILEQFEHTPDNFGYILRAKTSFFIPTDQERAQSVHMLQQFLEYYRTFV